MGAEGGCCSGSTDEALKAELEKYQRSGEARHKDIKASFSDLKESGEKLH